MKTIDFLDDSSHSSPHAKGIVFLVTMLVSALNERRELALEILVLRRDVDSLIGTGTKTRSGQFLTVVRKGSVL